MNNYDPHRSNPEVHWRLYDHPDKGPITICVQNFDYPDYDADRIMTSDAYGTEEAAERALTSLKATLNPRLEIKYWHEVCDVCKRDADLYANNMGYTTRFEIGGKKVLVVCDDCLRPLAEELEEKASELREVLT